MRLNTIMSNPPILEIILLLIIRIQLEERFLNCLRVGFIVRFLNLEFIAKVGFDLWLYDIPALLQFFCLLCVLILHQLLERIKLLRLWLRLDCLL
jgi:hypothetical protein